MVTITICPLRVTKTNNLKIIRNMSFQESRRTDRILSVECMGKGRKEKSRKENCRKRKHRTQKLYRHRKLEDMEMNVD